jgi:4-azaleucine resistance transporter AzlC
MFTPQSEFVSGVRAELPILLGVIPFGLIYGALAVGAGLPPIIALAMSSIVFAGSAQFIGAQLIGAGTPGLVIVLTTFVVNLRHLLYSASVAPHTKHLSPLWKWLLAYLLTDEAYAVTITHYNENSDPTYKHWYFLGAGLALWISWQSSTALGIFLGTQIPPSWSLDFSLTVTFIAFVISAINNRAGWASALTAGGMAVILAGFPYKLGLMIAALLGIGVGVGIEMLSLEKVEG